MSPIGPEEAKRIHQMEQLHASLRQGAATVFQYYQHLMHVGFTIDQALTLADTFQRELWAFALAKGGLSADPDST